MRKIKIFPLFLLLLLLVSMPESNTNGPVAHAQTEPITVLASNAQQQFPSHVTFALSAKSEVSITNVQLLYGASRSDSLTIVQAEFMPGTSIEARHILDTQVFHISPGVEVTYRWLIEDENGHELETPPQTFFYADDRFNWKHREVQSVTIHWYQGNNAFGDELAETTDRALNNLQRDIGANVVDPVSIYIYADTRDMRAALQSNEVEWVGGQAQPALGLIIGAIAPGDVAEIRRIIPHELSHQVLYQATENPYGGVPLWFEEGLAVRNQETQLSYHAILLEEAAVQGDLIPLEALAASFPTNPERASLSYAQSHSVVNYIIETYGTEAMHGLVAAFASATPLDEALQETIGLSVDELDAAWRETLPAAQVNGNDAPEPLATPQTRAPESRFSDEPVRPDTLPQPVPDTQQFNPTPDTPAPQPPSTVLPGLGLPLWAELGLALGCCTVLITLMGGTLLVILRMVGVDKRNQ